MNIFLLDYDLKKCAEYHMDKHVVKQILEYSQLLSGALIYHGYNKNDVYKFTHKNHPCSIWVRYSQENFIYLLELLILLCDEYTYRYNKVHKSSKLIDIFNKEYSILEKLGKTELPKCMPDDIQLFDVVESYRNYYIKNKRHLASWKNRQPPYWYK